MICCLGRTSCSNEEFQCHDGKCLSMDKRCNGKTECDNDEDEENCPGTTYHLLLIFVFLCLGHKMSNY